MANLSPTATLALHYRCASCAGQGYLNQDGRAARCGACDGKGQWEEPLTLAELAARLENHLGARPVPEAKAADEVKLRALVREEMKRTAGPRPATGKKGSR